MPTLDYQQRTTSGGQWLMWATSSRVALTLVISIGGAGVLCREFWGGNGQEAFVLFAAAAMLAASWYVVLRISKDPKLSSAQAVQLVLAGVGLLWVVAACCLSPTFSRT